MCWSVLLIQERFLADVKIRNKFHMFSSAIKDRNRICGFVIGAPGNHKEMEFRNQIGKINKYKRKLKIDSRCVKAWNARGSTNRPPSHANWTEQWNL